MDNPTIELDSAPVEQDDQLPNDQLPETEMLDDELLVEEISIDGMCGVY